MFSEVMTPPRHLRRALLSALVAGGLAATVAATPAVAADAVIPGTGASPPAAATEPTVTVRRLSDERLESRWAHPAGTSAVYSRPSTKARKVAKLRFFTEDGFPEVYLLLSERTDTTTDRQWVQIRLPKRPNGRKGWVPRDALGPYNVVRHQLVVNRRTLRATLYKKGRKVWSARVGVGAPGTITPAGKFWIREKFRFRNTPVYGTHAIGTSAYAPSLTDWPNGGVVGMHGTNQPGLIPGRPSHGCIRVKNPDIARLYRLLPVGTPLLIK